MRDTLPHLLPTRFPVVRRRALTTLQVNLGYLCNQACLHCHVNAGPTRKELMNRDTIDALLALMEAHPITTLDVTGGAPEMNPEFRYLMREARKRDVRLIDRCNLTIMEQPGYEWVADFLAEQRIDVVASLPCYLEENVDAQRGSGVFRASITALQKLNARGYGVPGSGLSLALVYNPQGPSLPPPQEALEADYKRHLQEQFGIVFTELYSLANMPIQRFGSTLLSRGQFEEYMELLRASYRPDNLAGVMCRDLVSIDWQGYVYDCDFNQMLGLPLGASDVARAEDSQPHSPARRTHIRDLLTLRVEGQPVTVADHCYGCTAGQGSSCGGALS